MKSVIQKGFSAIFIACFFISVVQAQELKWKFTTGGRVYNKPLIDKGILYIGSLDSNFYALNALSGEEIWRYKTADKIYTSAVIFDSIICFASGNHLFGLTTNNNLVWDFELLAEPAINEHDEWDNFNSSPLLADSIVYIGCDKGNVFGVNVKNGMQTFHCQVPEANSTIESKPVVKGDTIFFGDWDGVFYSYSIETEEEIWRYDTKNDDTYSWKNAIQVEPVILNDTIFFAGRSCNLYSLNTSTGQKNWLNHDSKDMWLLGGLTIDQRTIYLGSSNQFFLQAYDAITGDIQWTTTVDGRIYGMPFTDNNYVYVGTGMENYDNIGSLYIMDKNNGEIISRYRVNGQAYGGPITSDSIIYFGCADRNIYALDQKTMLTKKFPESDVTGNKEINLGELETNKIYTSEFYIKNSGEGKDTLYPRMISGGLSISPESFSIVAGDSQKVVITIDTEGLNGSDYTKFITLLSYNSLDDKKITVKVIFSIKDSETGVSEIKEGNVSLIQNFPNPFSTSTTLTYYLEYRTEYKLALFNSEGKCLSIISEGKKEPGTYSESFSTEGIPDGLYFCRLITERSIYNCKMIVVK